MDQGVSPTLLLQLNPVYLVSERKLDIILYIVIFLKIALFIATVVSTSIWCFTPLLSLLNNFLCSLLHWAMCPLILAAMMADRSFHILRQVIVWKLDGIVGDDGEDSTITSWITAWLYSNSTWEWSCFALSSSLFTPGHQSKICDNTAMA